MVSIIKYENKYNAHIFSSNHHFRYPPALTIIVLYSYSTPSFIFIAVRVMFAMRLFFLPSLALFFFREVRVESSNIMAAVSSLPLFEDPDAEIVPVPSVSTNPTAYVVAQVYPYSATCSGSFLWTAVGVNICLRARTLSTIDGKNFDKCIYTAFFDKL